MNQGWYQSMGEKFWKTHRRNAHWHEETDILTGQRSVHYDKYDPHESLPSLILHLATNKWIQLAVVAVAGDAIFNKGKGRQAVIRKAKLLLR